MKPYFRLPRFWADTDAGVMPAEREEAEIKALEAKYGVHLPADFRDYLLRCFPAESCGMDLSSTEWWGFSDIRSVSERNRQSVSNETVAASADKYLFFADFLVWAPAWAIACGDDRNRGRVVAVYNAKTHFVVDSFAEFVERYVVKPVDLAWLPSVS